MKKISVFLRLTCLCLAAIMLLSACATPPPPTATPDLSENFNSRSHASYDNINGQTVDIYSFNIKTNEAGNNPNFPQAVMLWQAIRYKEAYPEKEVYASIASFHFSVALAACLDDKSENYGDMKNLYDADYTEDGYYRIAYLCVLAAKKGIKITVIGQIDAAGVWASEETWREDYSFAEYFYSHLSDPTEAEGKTVGDFMNFRHAKWLSYGDKSATDMMHLKLCTVSNFIDNDGNVHGNAIWIGSINLDGIDYKGYNGNNSIQSATVITNHSEMYRILYNYVYILKDFCEQEDSLTFRDLLNKMATEQIDLINAGKENEIPKDKQIVYLGSENDNVFKLYLTPFAGAGNTYNTDYNPYCKYISELSEAAKGTEPIEFIWNAPKYKQNFELGEIMMQRIAKAFTDNANTSSRLHLTLSGIKVETFDELKAGENIGHISINHFDQYTSYHTKDVHLSYVKNGERHYVTLINTLNLHEGSMCYQSNIFLVIDETAKTGNTFYADYASMLMPNMQFKKVSKESA